MLVDVHSLCCVGHFDECLTQGQYSYQCVYMSSLWLVSQNIKGSLFCGFGSFRLLCYETLICL